MYFNSYKILIIIDSMDKKQFFLFSINFPDEIILINYLVGDSDLLL
mgnify:CR=1 FL=1